MNSTCLQNTVTAYENKIGCRFKPDSRFYLRVNINQKRYGQLLRGEKPILGYEARNLSNFFGVTIDDLI